MEKSEKRGNRDLGIAPSLTRPQGNGPLRLVLREPFCSAELNSYFELPLLTSRMRSSGSSFASHLFKFSRKNGSPALICFLLIISCFFSLDRQRMGRRILNKDQGCEAQGGRAQISQHRTQLIHLYRS